MPNTHPSIRLSTVGTRTHLLRISRLDTSDFPLTSKLLFTPAASSQQGTLTVSLVSNVCVLTICGTISKTLFAQDSLYPTFVVVANKSISPIPNVRRNWA